MQKQQGFTLIELVVVIIILGILAVVAAPKFINLQSDARASTLQGLKGAIEGANSMVFSKAALLGHERDATYSLDVLGDTDGSTGTADDVQLVFGYMAASEAALNAGAEISIAAGTSPTASVTSDWVINASGGTAKIWQRGAPDDAGSGDTATSCSLTYAQSTVAGAKPTITVTTSGC